MSDSISEPSTAFALDLHLQVQRMLQLALEKHPSYLRDCLETDPWPALVNHWRDDVSISHVDSLFHDAPLLDRNSVVDDQRDRHDLIGLFTEPRTRSDGYGIVVEYRPGDYTPRRNFTLCHELGHYLQRTDDELVDRLCAIGSVNYRKRFEEAACNRFASISLLPDEYVELFLDGKRPEALATRDLFEKNRVDRLVRVSRQAVVRRMADFLEHPGSVALVTNDKLIVRAHDDGQTDYDCPLTPPEQAALDKFKATPQCKSINALAQTADGPLSISVAASYAGPTTHHFIVTQLSQITAR